MKIGLDFDGVIADTSKLKQRIAKEMFGVDAPTNILKEKTIVEAGLMTQAEYRTLMNKVCGDRGVGFKMVPVSNSINYIKELLDVGHEVRVVTARQANEFEVAKEWLESQEVSGITYASSGYGKSKLEHTKDLDVFVEDDYSKLLDLKATVPHLFLMTWDYNEVVEVEDGITRVYSWHELNEHIVRCE